MRTLARVFFMGMLISFLGSLPLGTMNKAAVYISEHRGAGDGFIYAFGSLIAELVYVRMVLVAMHWVSTQYKLFRVLEWITLLVILSLSVASFMAAFSANGSSQLSFDHIEQPFIWGLLISITNPLHIPFWMGWSTVLVNKRVLVPSPPANRSYMLGISIGTIAGFAVFIYGGSYFSEQLKSKQQLVNIVVGIVLFATALVHLYKILRVSPRTQYGNN